jgi:hypothetical protein
MIRLHIQLYNFATQSFRLDNNRFPYFFTYLISSIPYNDILEPKQYDTGNAISHVITSEIDSFVTPYS